MIKEWINQSTTDSTSMLRRANSFAINHIVWLWPSSLVDYSHDERSPIYKCMHLMDWVPDGLFKMLEQSLGWRASLYFIPFAFLNNILCGVFIFCNKQLHMECWMGSLYAFTRYVYCMIQGSTAPLPTPGHPYPNTGTGSSFWKMSCASWINLILKE